MQAQFAEVLNFNKAKQVLSVYCDFCLVKTHYKSMSGLSHLMTSLTSTVDSK